MLFSLISRARKMKEYPNKARFTLRIGVLDQRMQAPRDTSFDSAQQEKSSHEHGVH
jgi:hypothetical protein